jgi:hypothetical protein
MDAPIMTSLVAVQSHYLNQLAEVSFTRSQFFPSKASQTLVVGCYASSSTRLDHSGGLRAFMSFPCEMAIEPIRRWPPEVGALLVHDIY